MFPMKEFFLSLRTTVWTLLALICLFFAGAAVMPANRDVFGPMNELLLFRWMTTVARERPWLTWWFFAALVLLALLAVNTIVCSIQAVRERWSRADALLRISPQIVHLGFLCILLAHLLGAGWGYRLSGALPVERSARLPDDRVLYLHDLRPQIDPQGNLAGWAAEVFLFEGDRRVAGGVLGPNRPLFYRGMGVYLKSFDLQERPVAYLMVNRDPGAAWALAGGILFTIGSVLLLALKWQRP